MNHKSIIQKLESNLKVFDAILENISKEQVNWKLAPDKWSLVGITNHILDEEKWDFKQRIEFALEKPEREWKRIEPLKWAEEERYNSSDLSEVLNELLNERKESIKWLISLSSPNWSLLDNYPGKFVFSAEESLANWLAHDYLHIRQINKMNWLYLSEKLAINTNLNYAGDW